MSARVILLQSGVFSRSYSSVITAPKTPARYKVAIPLHAVKLEPHPGSSLRDPTTVLIEIPTDSIIESEGQVAGSGLINVLWNGDAFSVFYEDLRERAEILTA